MQYFNKAKPYLVTGGVVLFVIALLNGKVPFVPAAVTSRLNSLVSA